MTFIEKLDYQMAKRSLNKHTLAALADVPYTTVVGFYTKGYSNVRMSTVRKLALALNISTDYLVDEDITDENGHPETPPDMLLPPEALKIAKRYDLLDEYGKNAVEKIIDCEEYRIFAERATELDTPKTKFIRLLYDIAAGPTDLAVDIEDKYEVSADSPADFAFKVSGDSMEPFFPDGSIQFGQYKDASCRLATGDIGVFVINGGLLCKQYVRDNYGNTYLISLNRDRADADVTLMASGNQTAFCYGKVLTDEKIPVQM